MLFPRQPFTDKYGRAYPYRPDKRRVFGSSQTQARSEERAVRVVRAKHILSAGNGMNIYRGCTHGCIYCDSRSACYGIGHDFEDIEVKGNAIELLESALRRKRTKCMLGTGSMTNPYIPLESRTGYVRKALALAVRYGFGFTLMTKSDRVLRDLDLLQAINRKTKCVVQMTLTTCDEDLCRKIEPNVSTTKERVEALKRLHAAGIPTVVWLCPILPFINDTEENVRGILSYCREAKVYGVICFGMGLTLCEGSRGYFYAQLDRLFPRLKERYVRTYGMRYQLTSPRNVEPMASFHSFCEENGILHDNEKIFSYLNTFEEKNSPVQLSLFDSLQANGYPAGRGKASGETFPLGATDQEKDTRQALAAGSVFRMERRGFLKLAGQPA